MCGAVPLITPPPLAPSAQNKSADELVARGGAMTQQAIDLFVQRDEWDKVSFGALTPLWVDRSQKSWSG